MGPRSNNNLNMFEEMHLAAIIHNGYVNDPVAMKAETVLKMATINGAALQQRLDTGSLEVGKKADIVAVNLDAPHMKPNLDPLALLVYSAQASDVTMTMVDGRILYEGGVPDSGQGEDHSGIEDSLRISTGEFDVFNKTNLKLGLVRGSTGWPPVYLSRFW